MAIFPVIICRLVYLSFLHFLYACYLNNPADKHEKSPTDFSSRILQTYFYSIGYRGLGAAEPQQHPEVNVGFQGPSSPSSELSRSKSTSQLNSALCHSLPTRCRKQKLWSRLCPDMHSRDPPAGLGGLPEALSVII